MLAYDYPILGAFWTLFWFFVWVLWLLLVFRVVVDIFRSSDLGGFAKMLWLLFVLVLPFLGVFVYVVARGRRMGERELAHAQARGQAFDNYIRETAGTGGPADELAKLARLRDQGVISESEFQQQKARIMA